MIALLALLACRPDDTDTGVEPVTYPRFVSDDRDLILKEIEKLGKSITASASRPRPAADEPRPRAADVPDKGYEYVVQSGDTLSAIVTAYREQGVKVTVDQVLKANPGLKASSLQVGKKIFIPAP